MSIDAPAKERIQTLDVLRGFALLGILIVNAPYFGAPWQTAMNPTLPPLDIDAANAWSWWVPHVFFEVKCITLFSMLFGVSIYLVGGERSDKERGANLRRRLGWMFLFGLLHGALIWFGDILLLYAICGLLVLLARSWRPRTLIIVGLVLYGVSALFMLAAFAITLMPPEQLAEMEAQMWAPSSEDLARIIAAYQGGLFSALKQNVTEWIMVLQVNLIGFGPRTIGIMMIGMALFKLGFLAGRSKAWVYWVFIAIGAAALAVVAWQAKINYERGFDFVHMQAGGMIANVLLSPLITLLYASILILLVKGGALGFITGALAPVGQMAFTNYLAQSLIMTTIFWGGRGFGLFGELSRPELIGVVVAIWVLQLIWSPLWLSRFQMGPLEWVWRRLTYKGPVALLKPARA